MLSELVEELKKTQAGADQSNTGPHVSFDACAVGKRRASEACLQPHSSNTPLKQNKLMEPSKVIQDYVCSKHNEEKKIFCRTDRKCICYICHIDDHKGHDIVLAETEMTQRQKELNTETQKINQRVQVVEKDIDLLQQELKTINESAAKAIKENQKMKDQLISLIKQKSSDLTLNIRQQQTTQNRHTQELLRTKEKELQKQKLKSERFKLLSQTVRYTDFLEKCPASIQSGELSNTSSLQCRSVCHFEDVSRLLSEERNKLHDSCINMFRKVMMMVPTDAVHPQDPKTNEELSRYSHQFTLDPNTASTELTLSEDNRKVTSVKNAQPYPSYLDRFLEKAQVLSSDPLPSCCYWEVLWSGLGVSVGVAYNDIKRQGPESGFGSSNKSWVLDCATKDGYVYRHNGVRSRLSACQSFRVGVFLDYNAGILIFYEVSETNKLIYKIQTTFTQPLYAGLGVYYCGATASMCVKKL